MDYYVEWEMTECVEAKRLSDGWQTLLYPAGVANSCFRFLRVSIFRTRLEAAKTLSARSLIS